MNATDNNLRILLLEDSSLDAELAVRELRKASLDFVWKRVQTRADFEKALEEYHPSIILADYRLPDFTGGDALAIVRKRFPDLPVIIVTGAVGEDTAVELFKGGATDFVLKERLTQRLVQVVHRALEEAGNVRERKRIEEQQVQLLADLRHLATHDHLTGVAARPLFLEKLGEAILQIIPASPDTVVFSIDLDELPSIISLNGIAFGDQILVETARRLSTLCWENDLVGSIGGDRYFVMFRRHDIREKIGELQAELKQCFAQHYRIREMNFSIQASIGGVVLDNAEVTPQEVLEQCHEAMQRVKAAKSKGIIMIDAPIVVELRARKLLDKEITEAVAEGRQELFFQPIVSMESGRIVGAEGLLRIRRRDGSLLEASGFMQSLARTGLINSIDETLIANFLKQHGEQSKELLKKSFRMSFNISPAILVDESYAGRILSQVVGAGLHPSSITLEILEEGLLPTNGTLHKNLEILREAGMLIAIDDFGIGYSNLQRLSHLPIQELKIPRELIAGIKSHDPRMLAVLKTTVGIAKNIGALIVAEGVETPEEADHLRELGCDYAQGYLYGRAMPLGELIVLVKGQVGGTTPT